MTSPSTLPNRRQSESSIRIAAGFGVGAVVTAFAVTPSLSTSGPTMCPMRLITGLPCPGCGLTRSWVASAHGDFAGAFSYNIFGPISFVATILFVVAVGILTARRKPTAPIARLFRHPVVIAVVVIWVLYGIARVIDHLVGGGVFPDIA
ncbi:DUF2752 domain-containing protein [Gordonia rubripertincta]|uniref:DUF2752 domain-containing protein n=1 Tax=Gordonia rubripertincta TaxID=36822 RepID=A0ABT4MP27_GORRU|nr:DUF2752 domain-containing protein [Gordonia rubripertincta]MCZ4548425.1 DUF2752 domain-containing protein [Gordonia rubripertincta]